MSKREEQKLAALLKKVAGQSAQPKKGKAAQYDDTLRIQPDEQDDGTKEFFKEMKRREF